jgi:hypothetical protein
MRDPFQQKIAASHAKATIAVRLAQGVMVVCYGIQSAVILTEAYNFAHHFSRRIQGTHIRGSGTFFALLRSVMGKPKAD